MFYWYFDIMISVFLLLMLYYLISPVSLLFCFMTLLCWYFDNILRYSLLFGALLTYGSTVALYYSTICIYTLLWLTISLFATVLAANQLWYIRSSLILGDQTVKSLKAPMIKMLCHFHIKFKKMQKKKNRKDRKTKKVAKNKIDKKIKNYKRAKKTMKKKSKKQKKNKKKSLRLLLAAA